MLKCLQTILTLGGILLLSHTAFAQDEVEYGFVQDPNDPLFITAVAYPNFTSNNVTISTAVFSFLLPEGTLTTPSIPVAPGSGSFNDSTGTWTAQLITPTLYSNFGFDPAELQGNDVYQVVLQNSPILTDVQSGVYIPLFAFRLPNDCMNGNVEILTNDGAIQQSILMNLGANFNNQMSMSIDDAPSTDIYAGNAPGNFSFPCPLNDAPAAVDDAITILEDSGTHNIDVLNNDSFGDNGPATGAIVILMNPLNGTATVDTGVDPNDPTDDSINYTSNLHFNGLDSLTYYICDFDGDCDTATVLITVDPVNDPPVAMDDSDTTNEDTPVTTEVLANDDDPNDPAANVDPTSVAIVDSPNNGTVSVNPVTGEITYTPDPNFNGSDTYTYEVCDTGNPLPPLCDTATVTIDVTPVNDPPVIDSMGVDVEVVYETTPEDTPVTTCVSVSDPDMDILSCTLIGPSNGSAVLQDDTCVVYTPDPNYNGQDTLWKVVCDPFNACDTVMIVYTVDPVNDAPIANDDSDTTDEDAPVTTVVIANDNDDADPAGGIDPTSVAIVDSPNNGTVSVNPVTGEITYTPDPNFNGSDTYTYEVCDTGNPLPPLCDTATVTIDVTPVNDPPVIDSMGVDVEVVYETTPEDTPVTTCVSVSDPDMDILSCTLIGPSNGSAVLQDDTCVVYTPDPNYNGQDTLWKVVCDPFNACDTVMIVYTVDPVNDAPIANDDSETTDEDTPVTTVVIANDNDDADPAGGIDPTSVAIVDSPNNGTVSVNPVTGEVTYTPDPNFIGTDTYTYEVCDTGNPLPPLCDTATVTIDITPVNDPPVIDSMGVDVEVVYETTPEDTPVTTCVSVSDPDMDILSCTLIGPSNGSAVLQDDTCVVYTPDPNYNGQDTLWKVVCDPFNACDTVMIVYTIDAVNDAPLAMDDTDSVDEDGMVTTDVVANDNDDADPAGGVDPTSVAIVDPPDNGTVSVNPVTGEITYTPDPDFNGIDTYSYEVCDTGNPLPPLCDTATVTITVNPINDGPIANDDTDSVDEDGMVTTSVLANDNDDADPAGGIDPTSVTITTSPANGTVSVDPVTGDITYTPDPNFNGVDTYSYQVCDTGNPLPELCDIATVTITVNPINDAPVAMDDTDSVDENTPVTTDVVANDDDPNDPLGNVDPTSVTIVDPPANGMVSVDPVTGEITYTPDPYFYGTDTYTYAICDTGNPVPVLCDTAAVAIMVNPVFIRLQPIVLLQGPLIDDGGPLMDDALRANGYIPLSEPYSALGSYIHESGGGGEMITDSAGVLADYGANSIVDWVFVELRDSADSTDVIATRAALVQRDGDVVDVDGVSPVLFTQTMNGTYFVSIRHRNHIGAMVRATIPVSATGTIVDFTDTATDYFQTAAIYDTYEQANVGGSYALWAGNTNADDKVVYAGQDNDKDPIFNEIDQAPGNPLKFQTYIYNGYHLGDVKLDGATIFAGQDNDVDAIFNNIDAYPANLLKLQTFVIPQQLPQ